jgi:hypothetical protein
MNDTLKEAIELGRAHAFEWYDGEDSDFENLPSSPFGDANLTKAYQMAFQNYCDEVSVIAALQG